MLTLHATTFVNLLHSLFATELLVRDKKGTLPVDVKAAMDTAAQGIIKELRELDLPHSITIAHHMLSNCKNGEEIHRGVENLAKSMAIELEDRKFYGPLRRYEQYYEQPKLFGDEVFFHFPSANNDIFEAGACLALERGTASVMHLMRVVEVGLKALSTALGVTQQNDWGSYLREIEKELAARIKASGTRVPDEQFYVEVFLTFDNVRRAWRNPTMHVDNVYSPERAEEILIAVRGLMRHLATEFSE